MALVRSFLRLASRPASRFGRLFSCQSGSPCSKPECASKNNLYTSQAPAFSAIPSPQAISENKWIDQLVANRETFKTLDGAFYHDPVIYRADLNRVWFRSWLFAGYTFSIPKPGDYFVFELDRESIILIRGDDNKIRGFFNVCRHRGSRIVLKESGHAVRLVCPYHQWSYSRDGTLNNPKFMHLNPEFDPAQNGLIECPVEEVGGLIFVGLSPRNQLPDFEEAREVIHPQISLHDIPNAKVAFSVDYKVDANWKLVYENNRECWHCFVRHPEYIQANYDLALIYLKQADGSIIRGVAPDHPQAEEINTHVRDCIRRWESYGVKCDPGAAFPGAGWYRSSRMPLRKGWVSESMDGKQVAPLMGNFTDPDMGSMRIHTFPNFWIHASADHAVSARLLPTGPTTTRVKVEWLVRSDAEEGKDYDLAKLVPFWKITGEQDWKLCEDNQAGVNSALYRPGHYSKEKEHNVEHWTNWYINKMKANAPKFN
eukprot:TRINITY_DN5551_c0_g4_i1.p1 TRINITY_DN5551_c0_g4~~TRINITY_DN5551_c0_g4_i1.p1  ORF type:complete len:484 (-),score=99.29 TRINITY_DN5551_c0_g4_i1:199-1650(-)